MKKAAKSPVTRHQSRHRGYYNLCHCAHCRHWRAKLAESDAIIGAQTKAGLAAVVDMAELMKALTDLLGFHDRVSGSAVACKPAMADQSPPKQIHREGGWSIADVKRLAEIRELTIFP